jgi:transcriptional regulator with XRE-family HTH domain
MPRPPLSADKIRAMREHSNTRKIYPPRKRANLVDAHIGRRIRDRRLRLSMSQKVLGELLGFSFQQVQKYEKGVNRISVGVLYRVAGILGVNVLHFYDGLQSELSGAEASCVKKPILLAMEFASSSEGASLIHAFTKIKDEKVRKRVLNLVKSMVQEEAVEED